MNINRRKFLGKSLLLSGASFTTYTTLAKTNFLTESNTQNSNDNNKNGIGYQNSKHNRHYYSNSRF